VGRPAHPALPSAPLSDLRQEASNALIIADLRHGWAITSDTYSLVSRTMQGHAAEAVADLVFGDALLEAGEHGEGGEHPGGGGPPGARRDRRSSGRHRASTQATFWPENVPWV
jgi:hypothetical protein